MLPPIFYTHQNCGQCENDEKGFLTAEMSWLRKLQVCKYEDT